MSHQLRVRSCVGWAQDNTGLKTSLPPRRGPPSGAGQQVPGAAGAGLLAAGSQVAAGPGTHRQGAPRCRAHQHGLPGGRAVAPRPLS